MIASLYSNGMIQKRGNHWWHKKAEGILTVRGDDIQCIRAGASFT